MLWLKRKVNAENHAENGLKITGALFQALAQNLR